MIGIRITTNTHIYSVPFRATTLTDDNTTLVIHTPNKLIIPNAILKADLFVVNTSKNIEFDLTHPDISLILIGFSTGRVTVEKL